MPVRVCPLCGEPLVTEQRETAESSVSVDACPVGDGVFVDESETQQLALGLDLYPLLLEDLTEDVGAPRQECPSCNEIMGSESIELVDEDVELDVCTVCHGLWIREDELSTMQAMAAQGAPLGEAEIDEIWDEQLPALRRRERVAELLGTLGEQEP
jgi:Zn-finger nucleic acid-binding protein